MARASLLVCSAPETSATGRPPAPAYLAAPAEEVLLQPIFVSPAICQSKQSRWIIVMPCSRSRKSISTCRTRCGSGSAVVWHMPLARERNDPGSTESDFAKSSRLPHPQTANRNHPGNVLVCRPWCIVCASSANLLKPLRPGASFPQSAASGGQNRPRRPQIDLSKRPSIAGSDGLQLHTAERQRCCRAASARPIDSSACPSVDSR